MSADPTAAVRSDFDRLARLAHEDWNHNSVYHAFLLRQLPKRIGEALDVGSGAGDFTRLLAARAERVLGLDLSPEMVRVARERSAHLPNVEFAVADVRDWAWPVGRFDCVATMTTMHHLPLGETLARMKAALRPGGVLLVLDLYQAHGLMDRLISLPAIPASLFLRLLHTGRLREPSAVRAAWAAHGLHDSYCTLDEVRQVCTEILPGAWVRRHLLWRYSIVWRAGGSKLLRMERAAAAAGVAPPVGTQILSYRADRHREFVPTLYAESFGEDPWPADWDRFDEFDPQGVFLAVDAHTQNPVGFAICFQRRDLGYISVVAVIPTHRRRGIASALVTAAIDYLHSLGLTTVRIDAYEESTPAVRTYEQLGFRVFDVLYE
jgi:SAM-dependent methyltransferase